MAVRAKGQAIMAAAVEPTPTSPPPSWTTWWRHLLAPVHGNLDLEGAGWLRVEELREGNQNVIRAEIPGIDPEKDVTVTAGNGIVRIEAHREEKTEHKEDNSYHSEFRYGSFVRELRAPVDLRTEDVSATYKDGILEVRIPVPTEPAPSQATRIPISRS